MTLSIRQKLLFVSVAVLAIPVFGIKTLRETERYLQSGLEDSLQAIASGVATSLTPSAGLLRGAAGDDAAPALFVHALRHPVQVDGYVNDWVNYLAWAEPYQDPDASNIEALRPTMLRLILGEYRDSIYALLQVEDETLRYRERPPGARIVADTIAVVFKTPHGELQRYYFSPQGPGKITPYRLYRDRELELQAQPVTNMVGEWQAHASGYTLELVMPVQLVGDRLAFMVFDVDGDVGDQGRLGTAGPQTLMEPGKVLRTSAQLGRVIDELNLPPGRRVWILNRHGQTLATGGTLVRDQNPGAAGVLFAWLLPEASEQFRDELAGASRLRGSEVVAALSGRPGTRWRASPDGRAVIVSAAQPVRLGNELVGAVVVEETTSAIQTLQREAMVELFNQSLLVFASVTLLMLGFASRLSFRINALSARAADSVDLQGRIKETFEPDVARDELGALSRSFAALVQRLSDYNDYLQRLGGRLAHELRTPLAMTRSSLENLAEAHTEEERARYLERAQTGLARLQSLVDRLSEATRLEGAIADSEAESVDVREVVSSAVAAYSENSPAVEFAATLPGEPIVATLAPDLLLQALDKLVANAVDFHHPGTPIRVSLSAEREGWSIAVANAGPRLPESVRRGQWQSMVSIRAPERADGLHLGLGLHVVRLIVEHYGGRVKADNQTEPRGAVFTMWFPHAINGTAAPVET